MFFTQNPTPAYIPHAKAWGFGGKIGKVINIYRSKLNNVDYTIVWTV